MIVAVTHENGLIFQHFGHTSEFKVYNVENGAIISSEVVSTGGSGRGARTSWKEYPRNPATRARCP